MMLRLPEGSGQAMLLTAVGGSMDAYSYAVRGGVFATGQTGNLVLAGLGLVGGEQSLFWRALVPITAFVCGAVLAQYLKHSVFDHHRHWRLGVLLLEIILLAVVSLIPITGPPIWANSLLSLSAALQFCCFKTLGSGSGYATVFCTGNLRSAVEQLYLGFMKHDREAGRLGLTYALIILSFVFGAALTYFCVDKLGAKAILPAVCLLVVAIVQICVGTKEKI